MLTDEKVIAIAVNLGVPINFKQAYAFARAIEQAVNAAAQNAAPDVQAAATRWLLRFDSYTDVDPVAAFRAGAEWENKT